MRLNEVIDQVAQLREDMSYVAEILAELSEVPDAQRVVLAQVMRENGSPTEAGVSPPEPRGSA